MNNSILRDPQSLFSAVMSHPGVGVAFTDLQGRFRLVNPAFQRIAGRTAEQLCAMDCLSITHPDDKQNTIDRLTELFQGDAGTVHFDKRYQQPNGSAVEVRCTLALMKNTDGTPHAILAVYQEMTDRSNRELRLRETAEGYRLLFQDNPMPMWVFDPRTLQIVEVNAACAELFGYTVEEFTKLTVLDVRSPEEQLRLLRHLKEVADGISQVGIWYFYTKDRRAFQAEVTAGAVEFGGRQLRIVMINDLKDRALRETEERLRTIGDNLPGGAIYQFIRTPDGASRFPYICSGIESMLGVTAEQVTADPELLYRLTHPDDLVRIEQAEIAGAGETFDCTTRMRSRNGQWRTIHCRAGCRRLPDGTAVWDGVMLDVTERTETERHLAEREETIRRLGDNLPGGAIYQYVLHENGQGEYTHLSAGIEKITGIPAEEFVAGRRTIADLIDPADQSRVRELSHRAARYLEQADYETTVVLPSGEQRKWHFRAATRRVDAHRTVFDGMVLDVTERRKLEGQIQQSQKHESIGVLAGGIAHDFNNLLTGVLGYASLLRLDVTPDTPAAEAVAEIEQAARRAGDLCKQMLAYSGRGKLVSGPIDLSMLVREMTQLLKTAISKKAVIRQELIDGLPTVQGDATQMRQVVMNLITNASDSLEDRPGEVRMRTFARNVETVGYFARAVEGRELGPGRYVCVEVGDTGIGMTADTLNKMFDPFFTTKKTGRGLGLAAVLGIVRSHHGALFVESIYGRGTTIQVWFPGVAAGAAPIRFSQDTAIVRRFGGSVLIVDDEEVVRNLARSVLESVGYRVLTASDGADGVETFERHRSEIGTVLMDLTMPRLNGIEALTEMRRITPSLPAVLMSGFTEVEVQSQLGYSDCTSFLQKPFSGAELVRAVRDRMSQNAPPVAGANGSSQRGGSPTGGVR